MTNHTCEYCANSGIESVATCRVRYQIDEDNPVIVQDLCDSCAGVAAGYDHEIVERY